MSESERSASDQLTAAEVALLVRVLSDPEERARAWSALQETVFNPDFWREVGRAAQATYLNPDVWKQIDESFRQTLDPELWRRAAQDLASAYTSQGVDELLRALASELEANGSTLAASAQIDALGDELGEAEQTERACLGDAPSLGVWLTSLSLPAQMALLLAASEALQQLAVFLDSMAEFDIADPVTAGASLVLAIAAFLTLVLNERRHDDLD